MPDTMTNRHDQNPLLIEVTVGEGRELYDLYREAHMPWEWREHLQEGAHELGPGFSSPPLITPPSTSLRGSGYAPTNSLLSRVSISLSSAASR